MSSGAKLVIAMFGAVVAIAVFVVAAFLLTDEAGVRCVEGDLQDNAVRADGSVLPRVERFETVSAAESFICRRIPHPRNTAGLALTEVRVARERNLGDTIEGEGGAEIELEYASPTSTVALRFSASFPESPVPLGDRPEERIKIQGTDAYSFIAADGTPSGDTRWNKSGWSFATEADLDDEFTAQDFFSTLESVR